MTRLHEWLRHSSLSLVAEPALEPVDVADVRSHSRIDNSNDDGLIAGYISAARRLVEIHTRRALITQTWRLSLDVWPCENEIRIPLPPLQTVTSIVYVDFDGATQTWDAANYLVDSYSQPGRITLQWNCFFPGARPIANSILVTFKAGYGDTPDKVPETFKLAIKQLVAHWYENREPLTAAGVNGILPFHIKTLLMAEDCGSYP